MHTFCLQNITLSVNHWFFLTILSNFRFGLVLKKWCLIKVSTGWQNIQGEPFSIAVKKNEKKGKNTIYLHSKKNISFDPSTKTKYMIIKLLYSEFCILMSYKVTKALGGQTLTWLRRRPKPANAFIAYCSRFNLTVYNQYRENCIIQGLLFWARQIMCLCPFNSGVRLIEVGFTWNMYSDFGNCPQFKMGYALNTIT